MWTDIGKERFFYAVKEAVQSGAQPDEMLKELETNYYMALDDLKKAAVYSFMVARKR